MSRIHPVKVLSAMTLQDWSKNRVDIELEGSTFVLVSGCTRVAECASASALSQWALDKGAALVRWSREATEAHG